MVRITVRGMELLHIMFGGAHLQKSQLFQKIAPGFRQDETDFVRPEFFHPAFFAADLEERGGSAADVQSLVFIFILKPVDDIVGRIGVSVTPPDFPEGNIPDPAVFMDFITFGQMRYNGVSQRAEPEQSAVRHPGHGRVHFRAAPGHKLHPYAAVLVYSFQRLHHHGFRTHALSHRRQGSLFYKFLQNRSFISGIPCWQTAFLNRIFHRFSGGFRVFFKEFCRLFFFFF